ncbi:MAG: SPOR domain-containing protein [Syntrophobacteraceae bacterium]
MALSKSNDHHTEKSEAAKPPKLLHFKISRVRLFSYGCGLVLSLCWMFAFGVLVGRGIPFVELKDTSVKAKFFRLMGLGKEPAPRVENAAETWDTHKMLESLTYYQNLTRRNASTAVADNPPAAVKAETKPSTSLEPASAQLAKPASKESLSQSRTPKPFTTPQTASKEQNTPEPEKASSKAPAHESAPPANMIEPFSLLICSLRDSEGAQRLLDQLKAKGYSPRIETLDLQDGGRWNRVLIGSFGSREEALRFAADFNRKERMEGLVIREAQ